MKNFYLILIGFLSFFHSTTSALPSTDEKSAIDGSLVIIGGALRTDNIQVWSTIVAQAGGKGSKIAVIPVASSNPERAGKFAADTLKKYGADAYVIPLSVKLNDANGNPTYQQLSHDAKWVKALQNSSGVFFTGGDQGRITKALLEENGDRTPLLNAIWTLYQHGGVIAGTSAGAAIMSTTMFYDAKDTLSTLKFGVNEGKEIAPGLGFIGGDIFIDQHLIIRGRFARMLPAMREKSYRIGLGIDENTALLVHAQKEVEIIGYKGAILIDLSAAESDPTIFDFHLKNVRIHYLDNGDKFEIQAKHITPAPEKTLITTSMQDDDQLSADFYTNIIGNTAVVELMTNLIDSKHAKATGIAFGGKQSDKPELGFEFTFSKTPNTRGYFSNNSGAEAFTVIDLRLDIKPIKMQYPLYR